MPVQDKRTDEVYLSELASSDVYVCIIGNEYGGITPDGVQSGPFHPDMKFEMLSADHQSYATNPYIAPCSYFLIYVYEIPGSVDHAGLLKVGDTSLKSPKK